MLWCDFYGSGSDRIGQSDGSDEYPGIMPTRGHRSSSTDSELNQQPTAQYTPSATSMVGKQGP
jgi:hypothetical protein